MSPDEQHKGETGSLDDIFNNIDDFSNNKPKISSKDSSRNKTYQSRTKERTYDVNLTTSQMISYDPLADEHLQDYFNSPHTRKHLVKLGLIEEDGTIVEEKMFKKKQIFLDKLASEGRATDQQTNRELDHRIEVSLRRQARKYVEKRQKLRNPGEGNPAFLAKYPISMQTTAIIYSESPSSTYAQVKKRSVSTKKNQAKAEYQSGKLKQAEEKLRSLLKSVAEKTVTVIAPNDEKRKNSNSSTTSTHQQPQKRKLRPKSARPTRTSTFPVSSAFSEVDSDNEGDNAQSDYEVDGLVDDEAQKEVLAKSTVLKLPHHPKGKPVSTKPAPTKQAATKTKPVTTTHKNNASATQKVQIPKPQPQPQPTISQHPSAGGHGVENATAANSENNNDSTAVLHESATSVKARIGIIDAKLDTTETEMQKDSAAQVNYPINEGKRDSEKKKEGSIERKSSKSNQPSINDIHSLAKVYGSTSSIKKGASPRGSETVVGATAQSIKAKSNSDLPISSSVPSSQENAPSAHELSRPLSTSAVGALSPNNSKAQSITELSKPKSSSNLASSSPRGSKVTKNSAEVLVQQKIDSAPATSSARGSKTNKNSAFDLATKTALPGSTPELDGAKVKSITELSKPKSSSNLASSSPRGSKVTKNSAEVLVQQKIDPAPTTSSARGSKTNKNSAFDLATKTALPGSTPELDATQSTPSAEANTDTRTDSGPETEKTLSLPVTSTSMEDLKQTIAEVSNQESSIPESKGVFGSIKNLFRKKSNASSTKVAEIADQQQSESRSSLTKSQALLVDNILTEVKNELTAASVIESQVAAGSSALGGRSASRESLKREGEATATNLEKSSSVKSLKKGDSKSKEALVNSTSKDSLKQQAEERTSTVPGGDPIIFIDNAAATIEVSQNTEGRSSKSVSVSFPEPEEELKIKDQVKIYKLDQKLERPKSMRGAIGKTLMRGISETGDKSEEGGIDIPKNISSISRKSTRSSNHSAQLQSVTADNSQLQSQAHALQL